MLSPQYGTDHILFVTNNKSTGKLYRSIDSGENWTAATGFASNITFVPNPLVHILMPSDFQTSGLAILMNSSDGAYRSTDHGASFTQMSLPVDPELPDEFSAPFAMAMSPNYATDHTLVEASFYDVFLSQDGGSTWNLINQPGFGAIWNLAISPNFANDGLIYAVGDGHEAFVIQVPEPASASLLAVISAVGLLRRRSRRA